MVRSFGGPEVLVPETIAVPACAPGEVLVRVHAAGVGPWDAWVRGGQSAVPQPLPLVPGSDVSGVVIAVGADVTGFVPGDAVYGATNARFTNGYAEVAPCVAAMVGPKPSVLSDVEAASAPVIAVTAWQMLFDHAALTAGQRVLIHGAGGNVGRYAVQLARHAGLEVLVTASAADDTWMAEQGVQRLVELGSPDSSVAAAIDLVGGDSQPQLFNWLAPGGKLISAVSEPDAVLAAEHGVSAGFILVAVRTEVLARLGELFKDGTIKPWVGEVLPLLEARAAHEMLAGTRKRRPGKIVLQP
jgi:NADPH:quinone reductase-like Zn-dependent oxidoreductase